MIDHISRLMALGLANEDARAAQTALRPRFAQLAQRHENGTAPRAVSAYQLFQTPVSVANQMATALSLKAGARVLEPSAGLGRLLDALKPFTPSEVMAVEVAPQLSAELYRQNRAGVVIKQRDFLAQSPAVLGMFDAVMMNPPFHMRADIQHIEHAKRFLKPGGVLVALCMDTSHRRAAFRDFEWTNLPHGSFKEAGTGVNVAMVIYRN